MTGYVTGGAIKALREKKGYTQKMLADMLSVSDKAVSKWETGKGLPDISLLEPIAKALGVSVMELISGEYIINNNRSGNMLKMKFYVCPMCGNIITSLGEGAFSCCGISLPPLEAEEAADEHEASVEIIENEYFISLNHPMEKSHYISFLAYVTSSKVQILKLYPEQSPSGRLQNLGHGIIYAYCNRHGLFKLYNRK